MPCVRPFACALPLLLACNGSLTMDVQALLQIVNSAGPLQRAAANRQRLGWVRRWAVSRRADRRSGKRAAKNLAGMAVGQQVQFLNRTRARRADETITLEGPRVKVHGSGRWKQLAPQQVLRSVFSSAAATLASLARETESSSRYLTDLLFMCGGMLVAKQAAVVDGLLGGARSLQWVVMQVMWDETRFHLLPWGEGRAAPTDVSVLAAHGHLMVRTTDGQLQEDEVTLRPCALNTPSASNIYTALKQTLPDSMWHLLAGSQDIAASMWVASVNLGSDHASSNLKFIAHIENNMPMNIITPHGLCKQHASGLCISPVVKHLNLMCPAFCIAKLFRRDAFFQCFRRGVRAAIAANLKWIRASEAGTPHMNSYVTDACCMTSDSLYVYLSIYHSLCVYIYIFVKTHNPSHLSGSILCMACGRTQLVFGWRRSSYGPMHSWLASGILFVVT